jgi:hypothetical protein
MYWVALVSLCTAGHAQKVKVEYDKNLDFSQFKTYAWGQHDAPSLPTVALLTAAAVADDLDKRGLKRVDDNPDLFVQMYGAVDSDLSVVRYNPLYGGTGGIPPFDTTFSMWGYLPGGTTSVQVRKGQLIVDLIDAKQKKLVWRGEARDKLSDQKDKLLNQVHSAVEKMFAQYPVKKP